MRSAIFIGLLIFLGALLLSSAAPGTAAAACKNADARAKTVPVRKAAKAVRCLVNRERKARGLRRVRNNGPLAKAARSHSRYEDRTNCISHQCPGEADLSGRVRRAGYPGCSCQWGVGEVIGWRRNAKSTPREMVAAWMGSAAHRAHLLNRKFRHIGVGVAWGSPRATDGNDVVAGIYTAVLGFARR